MNGSFKTAIDYTLPYTKAYNTEYYYPSGTKFVKNFRLTWDSSKSDAQSQCKPSGFSSGSTFTDSYNAVHDNAHNAAWINQDLNEDAGGYYIYCGYNLYLYATYDHNVGPAIDCVTAIDTSDGETVPPNPKSGQNYYDGAGWYKVMALNSPGNHPDLNDDAGGDDIYMYYHTSCQTVNADALRWAFKMALEEILISLFCPCVRAE